MEQIRLSKVRGVVEDWQGGGKVPVDGRDVVRLVGVWVEVVAKIRKRKSIAGACQFGQQGSQGRESGYGSVHEDSAEFSGNLLINIYIQ